MTSSPVNIFTGSTGLNTKVDPARLPFDPETGVQALAVAFNVDHDASGRVSRRKGYSGPVVDLEAHSLFCEGGDCFFVAGDLLMRLNADYTSDVIASVMEGARISYVQLMDRTYWMNGFEKGVIVNGVNSDWVRGEYFGPETDRVLSDPPVGTGLAYTAGRFYVTQANVVWYSDPYDLNAFDLSRSFFPFQAPVKMFRPVSGGFWCGDEGGVYFLSGLNPQEAIKTRAADYSVIQYTDITVSMPDLPQMESQGTGALFATTEGVCLGLPNGELMNLTAKKISYPEAKEGAALAFNGRYLVLLKP